MVVEVKKPRRVKISSKNQVTIPVDVMRDTGLQPGDVVVIRETRPGVIEIARRRDLVREVAGSMPGVWPPGAIDRLRDEWTR